MNKILAPLKHATKPPEVFKDSLFEKDTNPEQGNGHDSPKSNNLLGIHHYQGHLRLRVPVKYCVLPPDSTLRQLHHLLLVDWQLPPPSLILYFASGTSLIGDRVRDTVRNMLLAISSLTNKDKKVPTKNNSSWTSEEDGKQNENNTSSRPMPIFHVEERTSVWFVTNGLLTDPLVQLALNVLNERRMLSDHRQIVIIGCATWKQVSDDGALKQNPVNIHHRINYNHSHFLFTKCAGEDTGRSRSHSRDRDGQSTTVQELMCRVTQAMLKYCVYCAHTETDCTCKDPVTPRHPATVMLVCGSGSNILNYVRTWLTQVKTGHLLLYRDSGRVTNQIINACGALSKRNDSLHELKDHANVFDNSDQISELLITHGRRITVFEDRQGATLDYVILKLAFKQYDQSKYFCSLKNQYNLAVHWDRTDLVEPLIKELASESSASREENIASQLVHFIQAIKEQRDHVAILWIKAGIRIRRYFTLSHLSELYENEVCERSTFGRMLAKRQMSHNLFSHEQRHKMVLVDAGKAIAELLDNRIDAPYQSNHRDKGFVANLDSGDCLEQPRHELFLFAVLFNRQKLAESIWDTCDDSLAMSILAAGVLQTLSKTAAAFGDSDDTAYAMAKLGAMYEQKACDLLFCFNQLDSSQAEQWLVTPLPTLGIIKYKQQTKQIKDRYNPMHLLSSRVKLTPLAIADSKRMMNFIGEPCCQRKMFKVWHGRWKSSNRRAMTRVGDYGSEQIPRHKTNCFIRTYDLFTAPVFKFYFYGLMHLLLCLTYTSFVLVRLQPLDKLLPYPRNWNAGVEMLIFAWIITWFIQELHQLLTQDVRGVWRKIKKHVWDFWNVLDLCIFIFMFLLLPWFRLQPNSHQSRYPKMVYALTLILIYLRITHYFYSFRRMGPKIIMIQEMLNDLVFFLVILMIFVFSFGTALQVVVYPFREFQWQSLGTVLYWPYFQIFGELNLESIRDDDPVGVCKNATFETEHLEEFVHCNSNSTMATIIVAVYMMLSNVLLLNLLIALFTRSVDQIAKNTERLWRYNWYHIVRTYEQQPCLPPPFNILALIYRSLQYVTRCARHRETHKSQFC